MSLLELENWIITGLQSIFDQFGWLGVAGMMVFENATGLTPSEIILGLAGWFLISRHDYPFATIFLGGLIAASGSVVGASLAYWVARMGGRPVVDRVAGWFKVPVETINQVEQHFHRWGPGLVLFGRMVPGVRTLVSIPAGLARMPFLRFVLATFTGAYAWCTLLIGIGFWLGEEWEHIGALLKQYGAPLAFAALMGLALWWWLQRTGKLRMPDFRKPKNWQQENE